MRIKYIAEDDLNTIRINANDVFKKVVRDGSHTLSELFDNENIIKESRMEIEPFELDVSQENGKESFTDAENVQRVYKHMRFISDSIASDERVWAAYSLSEFIDYMKYRWTPKKAVDIQNRYLFGYSVQRSLFRNGISRLWWIGRFTFDESREDPFELTKFLCKDQDYIESICGRNIFNNPEIGLGALSALYDAEKKGVTINRDVVRNIGKHLNLLAGTYLIDTLDRNEIYCKVQNKLYNK